MAEVCKYGLRMYIHLKLCLNCRYCTAAIVRSSCITVGR